MKIAATMLLRKIRTTEFNINILFKIWNFFLISIFVIFSIRLSNRFYNFTNYSFEDKSNIITVKSDSNETYQWKKNQNIEIFGNIETIYYDKLYFSLVTDNNNIKYIYSSKNGKVYGSERIGLVKGKISDFFGSFPYITDVSTDYKVSGSQYVYDNPKLQKIDITKISSVFDDIVKSYYFNPVRPIPPKAFEFSSYKRYTAYFPSKIFYQVIFVDTDLGQDWLYCDNLLMTVGDDKKSQVDKYQNYIVENHDIEIYYCTYNKLWKPPRSIDGYTYITTEKWNKHFYIKVLNDKRKDFASKIAVR